MAHPWISGSGKGGGVNKKYIFTVTMMNILFELSKTCFTANFYPLY